MIASSTRVANLTSARSGEREGNLDAVLRWGAVGILLCAISSLLGGVWDIQWHEDVGPDTFTTAPHLLLYAGAAGAGVIGLAVTLFCTWQVRAGRMAPLPPLVSLLGGTFWAPLGFVVAGAGSALYLLFGLYDLWWHTVYGFDAVLGSPPHTGLGLADLTMLSGAVVVAATLSVAAAGVHRRLAAIALAVALTIFLMNSASWQLDFAGIAGDWADGQLLFVAALYPVALLAAVSVVRRPGAASLVGLAFTLLMAATWGFSAWATLFYAESLGLLPRETAFGYPRIVAVLPTFVLPAALAIDGVLVLARRWGWPMRLGVMAASATGMVLLVLLEAAFPSGAFALPTIGAALTTALAAGGIGAVTGWAGWKLGVVLRRLAGGAAPAERGGPAVGARGLAVALALAAMLLGPEMAAAHAGPVVVVHEETVAAGPYRVVAGFSDWPPRAERSLDMGFHLIDDAGREIGIAGMAGLLTLVSPSGAEEERRLAPHPRMPQDWGLDIVAFPEEGTWTLRFDLAGVDGAGTGSLEVAFGPRPGPPVAVGWLLPLAVAAGMLAALGAGWRWARPSRRPETWAWA